MSVYTVSNDIIVSSDSKLGAQNVSTDGSSFSVSFNPALEIPKTAINPILTVESAELYYTFVSIGVSQNNNKMYASDTTLVVDYEITIPDGLYSLTDLDSTIERLFANEGLKAASDTPAFELQGDAASGKSVLAFNFTDVTVEMKADSPITILGFPVGVYPTGFPVAQVPFYEYAPSVAQFTQVNSVLLTSSLVSQGIRVNDQYKGVISKMQINAAPGSQILYSPRRPSIIHIDNLVGSSINQARFSIQSEQFVPLDTNGETFSATIRLSWQYAVNASSRSRHQTEHKYQ